MTATKIPRKTKDDTRITPEVRAILEKVWAALWDHGNVHVYSSQWMKNPRLSQFVAPCGPRGPDTATGWVSVSIGAEYIDGIHVSVLIEGQSRKSFMPAIDFPGW